MRCGVLLSARNKSTRLPRKLLLSLGTDRAIDHLIRRIKLSQRPDALVLATGSHPDDGVLCEIAELHGLSTFRGSDDDKLVRYLDAARQFGLDGVVVVDGDDLFCDPDAIDRVIEALKDGECDYVTVAELPVGATPFGVSVTALQDVCERKTEVDTEVWGHYFADADRSRVCELDAPEALRRPSYRMTLDYPEDLEFFRATLGALDDEDIPPLARIVRLLDDRPDLVAINAGVQKLYEERIRAARSSSSLDPPSERSP